MNSQATRKPAHGPSVRAVYVYIPPADGKRFAGCPIPVAVEDDEIRVAARDEGAADALVMGQPGGRDAHGMEGLLEREPLVGAPVVEDGGDDAGPRLELLHRCVGAVREEGAGVEQRAEG